MRAVLWDVGGTIVDHAGSREQWLLDQLRACGVDRSAGIEEAMTVLPPEMRSEDLCQSAEDELAWHIRRAEWMLRGYAVGPETVSNLGRLLAAYFTKYKLVDGIWKLLSELEAQGVAQAVVSNWPASLRGFLAHHGVAHFFKAITCSGEQGILKPDLRMFRLTLDALSVGASEAIVIGDDPALDIAPARSLGMSAIHFDPRHRFEQADARTVAELRVILAAA